MKSYVEMVTQFHKANGALIRDKPMPVPVDVQALRLRLMMEELGELATAMEEERLIDVADGIVDLMYAVIGTAISYGLGDSLHQLFSEVHKSNMTKDFVERLGGKKGAVKGLKYTPPDLATIILHEQLK